MSLDVLNKTRLALIAVVTPGAGNAAVYDQKNSGDKDAPNVSCGAEDAKEDPVGSGNFWVTAVVSVKTKASVDANGIDPKIASDALSTAVFALLELDNDSLRLALSAGTPNYTVFGFGDDKGFDEGEEGDCWVETWRRRIYCCGSHLS